MYLNNSKATIRGIPADVHPVKRKIVIRGFPPEWCFSKRGREGRIVIALARWAKKHYACSKCFAIVTGIKRDDFVEYFCPDIDVLVVTQSEVICHEVKLLEGKKTGIPTIINVETAEAVEELKTVRLVDAAIYDGLGKALFNSLKSDRSYLVLPNPSVREGVLNVVQTLPIGLITFKGEGDSFFSKKEACYQRRNQLGDEIFDLCKEDEEKRCGDSALKRLIFWKKF